MIERKEYLERLIAFKEKDLIKVVTGVRRCGKSTLFSLYIDYLKSIGVSESQIVFVNLEDMDFSALLTAEALYEYIAGRLCTDKTTYVFIDEVQNCSGFEKAVNSLHIKPDVDVYITGSNAYMLSGELATLLSGRYVTIPMLPLSFKEYYGAEQANWPGMEKAFETYLRYGSFPYVADLEQKKAVILPYIEGIYNTIVVKDVAQRANISDIVLLDSIVKTLMRVIGSPVSAKKISDTLCSNGKKVSPNTVEKYMQTLCDGYLFYKVDRYDIKGRQHLKTLGKYYTVDLGIRNLLLSGSSPDYGHQLENIVYLELLRRGFRVNVGKQGETEVDFVARNMDGVHYYQVSASVLDENTLRRELAPLQSINDNHPKTILTMDTLGAHANYDGIRQANLIKWLLGEDAESV